MDDAPLQRCIHDGQPVCLPEASTHPSASIMDRCAMRPHSRRNLAGLRVLNGASGCEFAALVRLHSPQSLDETRDLRRCSNHLAETARLLRAPSGSRNPRGQEHLAPLPDAETIEAIIDAAIWASLRRE